VVTAQSRIVRVVLAVLALAIGLALFVSLPMAVFRLLSIVLHETMLGIFFPGFALYVAATAVVVLVHLSRRARGISSRPFTLYGTGRYLAATVIALVIGQLLMLVGSSGVHWLPFVVAASAPAIAPIAYASARLGPCTTWRRFLLAAVSGSILSTHLTVFLGGAVGLIAYVTVAPVRAVIAEILSSPSIEELFFSPGLVLASLGAVVVAPLVEELTKPIAVIILGRKLRSRSEAFLLGMAGGAGFAIMENMLYEASPAWAAIAFVRAIGGVLHPINAGMVALGWYAVRHGEPGARSQLLSLYGLAVLAHAAWNGGLAVLSSAVGTYFFGVDTWTLSIYGVGQPVVVLVLLIIESALLWRLLGLITRRLQDPALAVEARLGAGIARPRALAITAVALLFGMAAIGALYGPLAQRYWEKLVPFG
jgi:hypothetical protein